MKMRDRQQQKTQKKKKENPKALNDPYGRNFYGTIITYFMHRIPFPPTSQETKNN